MSYAIKQSTTAYPLVFMMIDSTDHVTGKTGLTPTVTLSKAGAAFGAAAGAVTEVANGLYKVAGNATDSGTLGPLVLHATSAGADPTDIIYEVVSYDPQDAVRLGLTALPAAAAEAAGGLYTRGTGAGQIRQDANGRVDANAKAWIDGTIPAVNVTGVPKVDIVDWLGGAPDALSSGKIPADLKLWLATAPLALTSQQVQVIVDAYASGQAPLQPTTAGRTLDVAATGEAGLDFDNIKDATGAHTLSNITVPLVTTTTTATNLTTNNDKTGYGLSAAAVQAIWDALTSALTTVGSIGKRLADDVDATISSRLAPTVAARTLDVSTTGEAGLDFDNIKDATGAHTLTNITVPAVTTTVNLTTNNDKTGYGLSAAAVQAIWDALTSALTTAGSIGKLLVDNINATISSRLASAGYTAPDNADILLIKAKTDNLPASPAAVSDIPTAATIAAAVWNILTSTLTTAGSIGKRLADDIDATISSRLATAGYTAPDNTDIATILTRTDVATSTRSSHSAADVWAAATRTLSAAGIQAIWDALTSALTTSGSIGKRLSDDIDATVSSRAAPGAVMQIDLTQALDLTPTVETVGDALLAARAQGFGKWTLVSTTLTLFANDGTTPLRVFTLDSATAPTERV